MYYKFNYLFNALILFINMECAKTFNVNFHHNYNLQVEPFNTLTYKREMKQFFDKASFSFNGFQKVESIPVLFPIDICVFSLEGSKYATTLHMKRNGERHFEVLKMNNGSYELIADIPTPNGIAMDCIDFNNKGYVAIALNQTEPIQYAKDGSPLYEIFGDRIKAVQYFAASNLTSVYLHASANDFFLLHAYANSQATPNLHCPYFKWSGRTFNKIGHIPCSNARQLTPFSIDYESYVAVANFADQKGRTSAYSEIYKYSREKAKFVRFQKIPTNGAVDVQYFNVPQNEVPRHFLVFGNSLSSDPVSKREANSLDADSVFYIFDKGQFVPYQKLSLYAVKKFLPIQNVEAEKFILLVACTDQDIKVYNFNEWKFEESKVQFTEGALGKGVSNMRIYQENGNAYLIIANNLMADNETNIFLPIFKQEQDANSLRQQIIDWAMTEIPRLNSLYTKDLGNQVEEKFEKLNRMKYFPNVQELPQANVQNIVTESLVYPSLKMSSNYWLALDYISQALDDLEIRLKQKQRFKRNTDAHENLEYVYDILNVKKLTINKDINAKRVNKVENSEPKFENIKAPKVKVIDKYTKLFQERLNRPMENADYRNQKEVLTVKNLQINGKLNGHEWISLVNNTLKRQEETQFLQFPIEIDTLKTETVMVTNDKVNDQDLEALISIDAGKSFINQAVQFAAPITVKHLEISERLNNLNVCNREFDVLLKRSNKTQVIEGWKNVTHVKVMDPITIAVKMMGKQLEAISPNKFIHEPLILQGNFIINGDVHINHKLNALDLIDLNERISTKQTLDLGIRMDQTLNNITLIFQHPLNANSSLVSFVNRQDLQRLVKANHDDIQIIEGLKVFNNSLEIKGGYSEVKNLNGIDMENLENNAFLKNNNQTIKVPMKIANISAQSVQSPSILLNNKSISDYLTTSGNQTIQGSLILESLKTQFLTVEHLNTDSKIFYKNLQDIYQQKARNAPQEDVLRPNRKFHGSIYAQNLIINTTINNKSVDVIENQILQLEGNIKYVGNFKFNYNMKVMNVTYGGKLNGIPAAEFGKCWLQKRAKEQVFTADQTFASVIAEEGVILQGKLNGFSMEEFITKTYWINRNEYIPCANFENPLEITTHLTTKTINDYMVPHDVFYKTSQHNPILLTSMSVNQNLIVDGIIHNFTSINNIKPNELYAFLYDTTRQTIYVENAHFLESPPVYETLNSLNLRTTLESVWLANENVQLSHHIEIAEANFDGLLEFEGTINDVNLNYLSENYFSKTRPQNVSVEIVFAKGAEVEKEFDLNHLHLFGLLKEGKSQTALNFNEFVKNTVKTSGPHVIAGNWSLLKATVEGNLNEVIVNQLNLNNDILLNMEGTQSSHVRAVKIFKNVYIKNFYADSLSLVNRVPVANWIKDAVYLYENYTISGITTVDSLNVFNNLVVLGKLNNITFNEHNLLLQNKNQQITQRMKIVSHLAQENRFLTNNIDHLYADYINREYLPSFTENLIPATGNANIKGHLSFKHTLQIERYNGPEELLIQNQWTKRNIDDHAQLRSQSNLENFGISKEFSEVKSSLNNISRKIIHKLEHFAILQTIMAKSAELFMLNIQFTDFVVDILAISDMQNKNVTTYKWMPKEKQFRKTEEFGWLPQNPLSLNIIQKYFTKFNQSIEVERLKTFVNEDLKIFSNVLSNAEEIQPYFEFSNQSCMQFQSNLLNPTDLHIFCLNSQISEKVLIFKENVQQIKSFGQKYIALLTKRSVLIYDTLNPNRVLQKIMLTNPIEMALASFRNSQFLAVLNSKENYCFVEIYRSANSNAFTLFQSLNCSKATHITFSFIKKSNDLLLQIVTDSLAKPYAIYQYMGVMRFREILSDSNLPSKPIGVNILNLHSNEHNLVALTYENNITFIELALNKI